MSDLPGFVVDASNVYVEGQGWFLSGGVFNTSQKLVGIGSNWAQGPPVLATGIKARCAVKVNYEVYLFCLMILELTCKDHKKSPQKIKVTCALMNSYP